MKRLKRTRYLVGSFVFVVLLLAVAAVVVALKPQPAKAPATPAAHAKPEVKIAKNTDVTSNMMFVGDVNWARMTQRRAESSPLKYSYITSGLDPKVRAQYDAWIGNLECPVTTRDVPYQTQVDSLIFNCRPEYLPNISQYFTAFTLANNHMNNNGGLWGLEQTRQNLKANGLLYFGTYDMNDIPDVCSLLNMPAHRADGSKTTTPVALCGLMLVSSVQPSQAILDKVAELSKSYPVIVMPHMGIEYQTTHSAAQETAYHALIDAGASVVLGAHPHVIQDIEIYKNKPIVYSMGNFLFDQQSLGKNTTTGLAVDVNLVTHKNYTFNMTLGFHCYDNSSGVPVRMASEACVPKH